jgi:NADPH2:quinone reductase
MRARLGVRVIAATSSEHKASLARADGAEVTVPTRPPDWTVEVRDATGGDGVDAVFDSIGKDTFDGAGSACAEEGG